MKEKDNEYKISDLGGSFWNLQLNGEKVVESPLSHGDCINIGPYKLEFFIGTPYAAQRKVQKTLTEDVKKKTKKTAPKNRLQKNQNLIAPLKKRV